MTALLPHLSLCLRLADATEPLPIMGSLKSPQNSLHGQVLAISGTPILWVAHAMLGSLGEKRAAPSSSTSTLSCCHDASHSAATRAQKEWEKHNRVCAEPTKTQHLGRQTGQRDSRTDRQLQAAGTAYLGKAAAHWLLPMGKRPPKVGDRVGWAAVKLLARLEEVMRQEEGLLQASPPPAPAPPPGQQLGWTSTGQGMPPCTLSGQECTREGRGRKGGEKKKSLPRGHRIIIK